MRSTIDALLERMDHLLIDMGDLCVKALAEATQSLQDGDVDKARNVMCSDDKIDDLETEIDRICLTILLREQPFARDLRRVIATTKMVTDLERIGDQAADIADIILISGVQASDNMDLVIEMAAKTSRMVSDSIKAFVTRDMELARRIIDADDEVDALFDEIRVALIELSIKNKEEQKLAMDMMMIIKYLERIGDHATNVAEWVEFAITGIHPSYEN